MMKTNQIILPLVVVLAAFACNDQINSAMENKTTGQVQAIVVKEPDTLMIANNNRFAFELYSNIRSDKGNTFFSPYSISAAMAMTYAGARGESEEQISKVLHFDADQARFHPAYKALLSYTSSLNKKDSIEISIANSMFAQKDYPFLDSYFKMITDNYGAGLQNLDFHHDLENSRKTINKWVEDKTKNKIQELIASGILTDLTRLVLVNAIYFYGTWDKAFNKKETQKLDFNIDGENKIQTDFMYSQDKFKYLETEKLKAVEIPYKGKTLSLVIFLPNTNADMAELEKQLDNESYNSWLKNMSELKIKLYLPKFKSTSQFELSAALKKMGMPHPFSLDADLSGMTGKKDLMIDKVIHKAFVEVNEKGTEAAAATAVVIVEKSALAVVPVFRADHPFIFIIKENKYNNILFMGRMNDPTK